MGEVSTRETIVRIADQLFYEHGFDYTSFANIADEVNISRGNFYHHFKSKDGILAAVIEYRRAKTRAMLDAWEAASAEPLERLRSFAHIVVTNGAKIKMHGCPVGTLCSELAKLDHVALKDANGLFAMFRDWLREQFSSMGLEDEADSLALHLLARSQGIAVLANTFADDAFVKREVGELDRWLDECASRVRDTRTRTRSVTPRRSRRTT